MDMITPHLHPPRLHPSIAMAIKVEGLSPTFTTTGFALMDGCPYVVG
jgi:hypothetical protein